jgi:hypothetical protein
LRNQVKALALLYGAFGLTESHSIVSRGAAENGLDTLTLECMYSRLSGGDAEPPHNSVSPGIRERNNAADLR